MRLALTAAALILTACSAPVSAPQTLGDAKCDFDMNDTLAISKMYSLPRTACTQDADCVLIASACGEPGGAHTKDAVCLQRIESSIGATIDCAPFESTAIYTARCEENLCVAKPDTAQP